MDGLSLIPDEPRMNALFILHTGAWCQDEVSFSGLPIKWDTIWITEQNMFLLSITVMCGGY